MFLIQPGSTKVFEHIRNPQQYTVAPALEVQERAIYALVSVANEAKL